LTKYSNRTFRTSIAAGRSCLTEKEIQDDQVSCYRRYRRSVREETQRDRRRIGGRLAEELAEKSGVGDVRILEWVNRADLFRIKGIGEEYSDLLEAAGVDTVPELAQRVPEHLLQKMQEVNAAKKLVRQLPGLSQVKDWVEQARKLPRVLTY
jgi:predicted flap endonuclease-1-like 5' DNA nuclease